MPKYKRANHRKARGTRITRLMSRDGTGCMLCGGPLDRKLPPESPCYITIDHILPKSKGGPDDFENYQLAHRECNERRGNDTQETPAR